LAFGTGLYIWKGAEGGVQFFTGYLLEKSLSLDNLIGFWRLHASHWSQVHASPEASQ
jgi:predicted tellurium resistance membrane protein TerC